MAATRTYNLAHRKSRDRGAISVCWILVGALTNRFSSASHRTASTSCNATNPRTRLVRGTNPSPWEMILLGAFLNIMRRGSDAARVQGSAYATPLHEKELVRLSVCLCDHVTSTCQPVRPVERVEVMRTTRKTCQNDPTAQAPKTDKNWQKIALRKARQMHGFDRFDRTTNIDRYYRLSARFHHLGWESRNYELR